MTATVLRFLRDSSGATALEYAVIGSLISIAVVAGAMAIGSRLDAVLSSIVSDFH